MKGNSLTAVSEDDEYHFKLASEIDKETEKEIHNSSSSLLQYEVIN